MSSRTFANMIANNVAGFSLTNNTLSLTTNIVWKTVMEAVGPQGSYNANDYITIEADEIFDGAGYEIDMDGVNNCDGLFACNGGSAGAGNNATIKNLGVTGGATASFGGFIVKSNQAFFTVDDCYSTGEILGESSGGICGFRAGKDGGSCTITNCYSTGPIGGGGGNTYNGGICGQEAGGISGVCTIIGCYSTGSISGEGAGGICGRVTGQAGTCIITSCYSTGPIQGSQVGGICGHYAGNSSGTVTITKCYATGSINGSNAGGICGNGAGTGGGTVTVTDCFSNLEGSNTEGGTGTGNDPMDGNFALTGIDGSTGSLGNAFAAVVGSYPILSAFQALPWENNYTLAPYYDLYTITAQFDSGNDAGLGGEPFIFPVHGKMYETPMKVTSYRMLQGRKLIMNMSQRRMTKQEGDVVEQYYKQIINEEAPKSLVTEGVYINKAFLKADGQTMEYDFDTGKGQMSSDYFTIKQETKKHGDGKYLSSPIVKQIHVSFNHSIYGRMTATLNHYSNPQMKSGVTIHYKKTNSATKELTGLLVREYKCKSMECRKLHKTKKLQGKVGTNKVLGYLNDKPKN